MKLSILVSLLVVVASTSAYPSNSINVSSPKKTSRTWFSMFKKVVTKAVQKVMNWNDKCHGLDCPEYEKKKSTDEYESRCYPSYAWVGTSYTGDTLSSEERKDMFMRLFHYISGENVDKIKIKMTVPVATKVESVGNQTRWTMLFFVPFKHQTSPPKPTNSQVAIVRLPKTCVYVKSFSWFTSEDRIHRKIEELESALKKDDITDYIDPETAYIYGGYDSPWTIPFLRHNEVWLVQN